MDAHDSALIMMTCTPVDSDLTPLNVETTAPGSHCLILR
jgi:hypothetical protein